MNIYFPGCLALRYIHHLAIKNMLFFYSLKGSDKEKKIKKLIWRWTGHTQTKNIPKTITKNNMEPPMEEKNRTAYKLKRRVTPKNN